MNPATECELIKEKAFLETVYHTYRTEISPQMRFMQQLTMRTFAPHVSGGEALEMGCSDGFMTEMISGLVDHLDVVDGSGKFVQQASARGFSNVNFICSLFEEFVPSKEYDHVFASYILEHVLDPIEVLQVARSSLKPGGLLFVIVPNARAFSRQMALHMGLLNNLKELTKNDHSHGHRRVYDRVSLNRDLQSAGFETISQGGLQFKILADFQLDQLISDGTLKNDHLEALYSLGMEYPDFCGSIFSICKKR
ncbi:MAG: class I SAM-dependent methyltransferase [Verrucomicrobia bacterium]|nr:class I SAM-dependent methyltransferase [Verrucomicrobiota bacterium]